MYENRDYDDIDIDGCDSNGNQVAGYGYGYWYRPTEEVEYVDKHIPMYEFYSLEDLVTSKVFQEQLSKALAFKDKQILALQQEIINNRTLT